MPKLLNFVTHTHSPFAIIQHPSFSELLNSVAGKDVKIPKPKAFMDFLHVEYDEMKIILVNILSIQQYLCITCDVWSSRAVAFLGMTVHFINENFERESSALAFRNMKNKQTHEEIATEMIKVLAEFEISVEKVTNIVTDGGSSFCKAFKVYGKGSDSLVEIGTQHVIAEEESENDNNVQNLPFIQSEGDDEFYTNILNFGLEHDDNESDANSSHENFSTEECLSDDDDFFSEGASVAGNGESESMQNLAKLPQQRRCLPHVLNLVPNDFEKQLNGRAKSALISTFDKLQSLWVFPRRSSEAKTICKKVLGCISQHWFL